MPLLFLDTETTGLDHDDEVWEVAAILRADDGTEQTYEALVQHDAARAARLPEPFLTDHRARYAAHLATSPAGVVDDLRLLCGKAEKYRDRPHVVGMVPSFDTERLGRMFRAAGVEVPWHHHLIDAETLAVGWLRGQRLALVEAGIIPADSPAFPGPPWTSDDLSRAVGVEPDDFDRHTAVGDVLWARAVYDVVMGSEQ